MFSGSVYEEHSAISAWKYFRIKLNKHITKKQEHFIQVYTNKLERWETAVKRKLGQQLPKKYWNKARPNPLKKFVYRNTGKLQKSIHSRIKSKITESGNLSISAWVEIGKPYAIYANRGVPPRKSGVVPHWVGWIDDVIFGHGRSQIVSVSDIFKEMANARNLL